MRRLRWLLGITANPAIGNVADRIIACGGKAVLSETTELYGAEHLLVARSRTPQVAKRLLEKIEWWKQHVAMFGGVLDNNPSVGNKAGGLTTITEKSLGAVSKSGTLALEAVYDYAQPIDAPGLGVMDTPGFDPSSVTGKVAGVRQLNPVHHRSWQLLWLQASTIDQSGQQLSVVSCTRRRHGPQRGTIIEGESIEQAGERFFEFALQVASGQQTASEKLGFGDFEFVPWTVGPVL